MANIDNSANQRLASAAADQSEASNQAEWAPEFGLCETPQLGPNTGQCQYFNGSEDKEKNTDESVFYIKSFSVKFSSCLVYLVFFNVVKTLCCYHS